MLLELTSLPIAHVNEERRECPRQVIDEEAEFFIPTENLTMPCVIVNISTAGAKITCDAIPTSDTRVALIFKDGRRIEAVTTRYGEGELALKFISP